MLTDNLFKDIYAELAEELQDHNKNYNEYNKNMMNDSLLADYEIVMNEADKDKDWEILASPNLNIITDFGKRIIFFNTESFISKILISYKNNTKNVLEQFNKDLPRGEVYLNNKRLYDYDESLELFKKYNLYKYDNIALDSLLIMLCCQSSFAFPYLLMLKLYNDYEKNYYVVSNKTKVCIFDKGNNITVQLYGIFNLKSVIDDKILKKITTVTQIDVYLNNKNVNLIKFSLTSWNLINQ